MLSTNDRTDTRYRYLAEGDIQFGVSVVVPQGGWQWKEVVMYFFKLTYFSIFPEKLRKTTKKFKIFLLCAGIQTHHI